MLSRLAHSCSRLYRRAVVAYLRARIRSAEFDCNVIHAEMLSGPGRLRDSHAYITDLASRIAALEESR